MSYASGCTDLELVLRIALQFRQGQNFPPQSVFTQQPRDIGVAFRFACIYRAVRRIITSEISRIYDYTFDLARHSETSNAPVESFIEPRASPSARFPTIHPLPIVSIFAFDLDRLGLTNKVFFPSKEIVVGIKHGSAKFFGGEVDEIGKRAFRIHLLTN